MKHAIYRWVGLAGWLGCVYAASAQVAITEFMANNNKTLRDRDGEYSDWIEIRNTGSTIVNLAGWHLTDSRTLLAKWRFPSVSLAPNAHQVVFASGKDRSVAGAELHANFSLGVEGEYLALVMPDAVGIASEFDPSYPEQFPDVSYGDYQGTNYYFTKPTPGTANGGAGFIAAVADTKFSQDRGFFDAPFDLTLRTATTNAVIRYTTNGLPPSATNGIDYSAPIRISSTTTLRATAFKAGHLPSNVDTQTYIFLNDVIRQAADGQPPPGWPTTWGSNVRDYGMDPDVVNNPLYSGTIKNDLKSIPTFSLVLDLKDLFDSTRGIYANPGQEGRTWERPASVEMIHPDGKAGFQINAGLRIRGGFSRNTSNPKHAFRLFFREEYGTPKLKYPLFGDAGTDSFDNIDLRTFQNYSWSFQGDANGVFLRDQFSRDTQLDMGHQTERGNYYHLYINGQYWGLYNTCERPEASFGETYYGGKKEDYDVIKVEAGPYALVATDGNMTAWTQLYNAVKPGVTEDVYQRIQGRNPDGTRNPDYPVLLDPANLMDYMLVILYGGNLDAPISSFLGNTSPNNWYGMRNRNGSQGFQFFAHDAEHTLLNVNENRTGPYTAGEASVTKSSPQWIWQKLQASAEFRLLAADHIHRHFFNTGTLTPESARARFLARRTEIDRAVVAESARWGDSKRATSPLTRDAHWVPAINNILNNYLPRRTAVVLGQLKTKNLYPNVVAPAFNQHGGNIQRGFTLAMSAPAGTIYYTRDGSDPRLMGGTVSGSALPYGGPIALNESATIKSRVLSSGTWSALNEAPFTVIQTFTDLLITEIMFNPPGQGGVDGDEFEFIELKNVSNAELDLSGVRFSSGILYAFPIGAKIGPGQFAVLASNPAEFQKKYPGARVAGSYAGRLSNGGETVALVHAAGAPITAVAYADQSPWPKTSDGEGFSLVPVNPNLNFSPNDPASWRTSTRPGGSPGSDDPAGAIPAVWINEVLTHTDPPAKDAIELFNPNAAAVDVSNWYLTDSRTAPKKFRIPSGTVIPAGGYLVFTEDQFNRAPGVEPSFNLSSHGEEVYLYSADAAGNLTGFSDGFSFDAVQNGVSFGRYSSSVGEVLYPAQASTSLGAANLGPRVGPVVISEIQFQPPLDGDEFIELKNISASAVKLYDPAHATNRWRLNGVGLDFPATEIPANGHLLVVATDPSVFRSKYGVPSSVPIFGPFAGSLQDSGELLQIQMPDEPDVNTDGGVFVPYIDVDAVRYNDKSPWPTNAAGLGASIERVNIRAYGNDPANWRASPGSPSPGLDNGGNRSPQVNAGADLSFQSGNFPFTANLAGTGKDDGQPNPPGALNYAWTQVSGPGLVVFGNAGQSTTQASFPGVGTYVLRFNVSDGAIEASDELTVKIERSPTQFTFVPAGSTWKYRDNGSDQGTAWRAPAFNDSAWAAGRGQLGYGDGDEATAIQGGPTTNRFVTAYFRHAFNLSNASSVTRLTAKLMRDDGAIVYLNGTEVFRSNMPEGNVTHLTFASAVVGAADESAFFEREIDPSLLVEGNNVLAVELHQVNATSSDVSFDFELGGLSIPKNQPPAVNAGSDLTISPSTPAALSGTAIDDGLPIPPGKLTVTWTQVSGPGAASFLNPNASATSATFGSPGSYVLRLTATDGELTVIDDVTVIVQDSGFSVWKAKFFNVAELANPAVSGDDADPDGDGHANFQEFTAGTDPINPQSVLKFASVPLSAIAPKLRFAAVAGKTYTIQFRDDLSGSGWRKLADVSALAASQFIEVEDPNPPSATSRFYRVVTPRQP